MKFWEKGVVLGFVLVLLFVFWSIGGNITGKVIEDLVDVGNCSDVGIDILWDNVFVVDSSNLIRIKENVVGGDMCEKYVVYKNNSNGEVWVLYEKFYDSSWVGLSPLYVNGKKVLNKTELEAYYYDVNESFLDGYVFATDVDGVVAMGGVSDDDFVDWSVVDEASARNKFVVFLDVDVSGDTMVESLDYFEIDESSSSSWWDFDYEVLVNKNESVIFITNYVITNYDSAFVVDFSGTIPDFEFDRNSSWNFAFDVDDYFNLSDDVVLAVDSFGTNNTNGVWVDVLFGDNVSFKPAVNFIGTREFVLTAANPAGGSDAVSNSFNVTIVVPNDAPVLFNDFDSVPVPRNGGVNVYLDAYFMDPDGDNMTYRVSGETDDLNITIDDAVMIIRLEDAFNSTVMIRVYASDGIGETKSNRIYVFEEGEDVLAEGLDDDEGSNASVSNDTTSGNTTGRSGSSSVGGDDGSVNWWLWGTVGGVLIVFVMVIMWFVVLRKKNDFGAPSKSGSAVASMPPVVPRAAVAQKGPFRNVPRAIAKVIAPVRNIARKIVPAQKNPVNDYLDNLNLRKK